jgi:hypothetical protein
MIWVQIDTQEQHVFWIMVNVLITENRLVYYECIASGACYRTCNEMMDEGLKFIFCLFGFMIIDLWFVGSNQCTHCALVLCFFLIINLFSCSKKV